MRLNKIVSGAAVAAMLGTMMCTTAFAVQMEIIQGKSIF